MIYKMIEVLENFQIGDYSKRKDYTNIFKKLHEFLIRKF